MTVKEKGFEILKRYIKLSKGEWTLNDIKQMSIVAVEEIVEALKITTGHCTLNKLDQQEVHSDFEYWAKVREEIEQF